MIDFIYTGRKRLIDPSIATDVAQFFDKDSPFPLGLLADYDRSLAGNSR